MLPCVHLSVQLRSLLLRGNKNVNGDVLQRKSNGSSDGSGAVETDPELKSTGRSSCLQTGV